MKTDLKSFSSFYATICNDDLVFMFGTGISSALTREQYSWYKWISDGISCLKDRNIAVYHIKKTNDYIKQLQNQNP